MSRMERAVSPRVKQMVQGALSGGFFGGSTILPVAGASKGAGGRSSRRRSVSSARRRSSARSALRRSVRFLDTMEKMMPARASWCQVACAVLVTACADPEPLPQCGDLRSICSFEQLRRYVSNTLEVPTDDSAFGRVVAALADAGVDAQAETTRAVSTGRIVLLHEVVADYTRGGPATWQLYRGRETGSPPDFTGHGFFQIAPESHADARLTGSIVAGTFTGGRATVEVQLGIADGGGAMAIELIGAQLQGSVSETFCDASLAGGVRDVAGLVADLAAVLTAAVSGADGPAILGRFDLNGDLAITPDELSGDPVLGPQLVEDVDLLNGEGYYEPGVDGVNDALSLAVTFACVRADFTYP